MRTEYIQLKVLPGNNQDVMNGSHNAPTASQLRNSILSQGDKEITKVLLNHSRIKSPFHRSMSHMALSMNLLPSSNMKSLCLTEKLLLQFSKVDLWFRKVVLCLVHHQTDAKVVDFGCSLCFGLAEVKCPYTKFHVTPLESCSDPTFFMEKVSDTKCKLKRDHPYYAQVQAQLGIT